MSYHNVDSNLRRMNIGVPQGSVLGPLLFLLYINYITRVLDENSCILFDDDTTLLFTDMDHCGTVTVHWKIKLTHILVISIHGYALIN